jgi:hypothetical protein
MGRTACQRAARSLSRFPARHRMLTPALLDLKRLYCHVQVFWERKRKRPLPVWAPGPETARPPLQEFALRGDEPSSC